MDTGIDRRSFLGGSLLAGAGMLAGSLMGCAPQKPGDDAAAKASDTAANDWLGSPPTIADSDVVETVDTQVLVVGAGNAGYFTAAFAAQEGAQVLLIEKNETGCGIRDSALAAVGSRMQKAAGINIDASDIVNDFMRYANGQANPHLFRLWAENSGAAVDWFCDLVAQESGITVDLESSMPAESVRFPHWPTGHGTNDGTDLVGGVQTAVVGKVMKLLDQCIIDNGGEIRYLTPLVELIKDGDRVSGAFAKNKDGGYVRINASKGVVVATGGYVNNQSMYEALQGSLLRSVNGWCCHATLPATGDGIKACLWAGASFDTEKTSMIFDRGLVGPTDSYHGPDAGGYYFTLGSQPFLKVDERGERFCNESSPYDHVVHAANRRGDGAWRMIWDSNWKEDVLRFHTIGCSTIDLHEAGDQQAMGIEATEAEMEDLVDKELLVKADTIEELAKQMDLDASVLTATVKRYNELFDQQEDMDFGKEAFRLSALRTPPFYGAKLGGLLLCTLDGIVIDEQFRALDSNRKPIEGLYVLGNDSGSYYASTYPNLAAGTNAGRCVTHGMLCGKALAHR